MPDNDQSHPWLQLTAEAEAGLCDRLRLGDPGVELDVLGLFSGMVTLIICDHQNKGVPIEELETAGSNALRDAIARCRNSTFPIGTLKQTAPQAIRRAAKKLVDAWRAINELNANS